MPKGIKLGKKRYCLTKCAKDNIEKWVLTPLAIILGTSVFIAILCGTFFLIGLATYYAFDIVMPEAKNFYEYVTALGFATVVVLVAAILAGSFTWGILQRINRKIDKWISTPYRKHVKKSCQLFEECDED